MMRRTIFVVFTAVAALAGTSGAQTNLGLIGGALFPIGDFADAADLSPYVGARFEVQDVNALGQTAELSFLVAGGFSLLQTDADVKAALGTDDDGSYFDIGAGVRAHSTAVPLYISAGVAYMNLDPAGSAGSDNGFGGYIGLGLTFGPPSFGFEVEGRASVGFFGDNEDIEFFQLLAGFGFPI